MKLRVRFPPYSKEVVEEFLSSFTEVKTWDLLSTPCWMWVSKKRDPVGRPYSMLTGRGLEAPCRISYRIYKGEIPRDIRVKHICEMVGCVNPDHLRIRQDKP